MPLVYLSDIGGVEGILYVVPRELYGPISEYLELRKSDSFREIVGLIESERTRAVGCSRWKALGFEGKFGEIRSMVSNQSDREIGSLVSSRLGIHQTVNSIESLCDAQFPAFFAGAVLLGAIVASIGIYRYTKYLNRKNKTFAKTF